MLTDNDLRKLAQYIVSEQAANPEWMLAFAKAQAKLNKKNVEPQWVNTNVAAGILGLSARTMRAIKGHFSYIKKGDENQSSIYFDATKIREEYDAYLANGGKAVGGHSSVG